MVFSDSPLSKIFTTERSVASKYVSSTAQYRSSPSAVYDCGYVYPSPDTLHTKVSPICALRKVRERMLGPKLYSAGLTDQPISKFPRDAPIYLSCSNVPPYQHCKLSPSLLTMVM